MLKVYVCRKEVRHPDDAIGVSGDDDVLRVPLVHLGHAAAQDLLAAAREGVGAGDGAAVDAPHVHVGSCAGHDVTLHTGRSKRCDEKVTSGR